MCRALLLGLNEMLKPVTLANRNLDFRYLQHH